MRRGVRHVDIYDTTVSLWDDYPSHHQDERRPIDERLFRDFRAFCSFLKRRGWKVTEDPHIKQHHRILSKWHRLASKGELHADVELTGRVMRFEMWQETHGITHPSGGRYDSRKRALMPPPLRLLCDLETKLAAEWMVERTGYRLEDRRYLHDTADARIQRDIKGSGHYVPTLGRAKYGSDSERRSADGVLVEHGQQVWFYGRNGRMLRGHAFHRIGSYWYVRLNRFDTDMAMPREMFVRPPSDLRTRDPKRRKLTLQRLLKAAVEAEDYLRAHKLKTLLAESHQRKAA